MDTRVPFSHGLNFANISELLDLGRIFDDLQTKKIKYFN